MSLRSDIAAPVDLIRRTEQKTLPVRLGWSEDTTLVTIDFSRCQPVGFDAGSSRLSDYFRAVRWLQMVSFRAARNHEMDAIFLLGTPGYRLRDHSRELRLDMLIVPAGGPMIHAATRSLFPNEREPPDMIGPGSVHRAGPAAGPPRARPNQLRLPAWTHTEPNI